MHQRLEALYFEMFGLYKALQSSRCWTGHAESRNFSPNFSPNRAGVDYTLLRANRHQLITWHITGGNQTNIQYTGLYIPRHSQKHKPTFSWKNTINISGSTLRTYQDQMSQRCQWNQNYFYNEGSLGSLQSKVIFLSLTMRVQMSTWQFSVSSLNILCFLINVFYTSINTQLDSN